MQAAIWKMILTIRSCRILDAADKAVVIFR